MQRTDLIGRHQLHGARGEDANAVERAAVANHLQEPRVVARRRQETRAAGEALARTIDIVALAVRPVRRAHDLPVAATEIDRRETLALIRRQEELRVLHAEWTGDPRANELVERRV